MDVQQQEFFAALVTLSPIEVARLARQRAIVDMTFGIAIDSMLWILSVISIKKGLFHD